MLASPLATYLKTFTAPDPGAVAYIAALQAISQTSPEIVRSIVCELEKQRSYIKLIANVARLGLTGRQAEAALHECGITLNRNSLPFDQNGPWYTSGLRIGTPAVTTLGMGPAHMKEIGSVISLVLKSTKPMNAPDGTPSKAKYQVNGLARLEARKRVKTLLDRFPVYPELDLHFMKRAFCG